MKRHVCNSNTCLSRFSRVEEHLVSNPLAKFYELVLRVRKNASEVDQKLNISKNEQVNVD